MSYEVNPWGLVGTIRQSIQGVMGFSIVKELIQNADDSGAKRWVLGLHDGFPDAYHPLLRGKALYVINDGAFRREHAKALVQLHLSGKASDQASIGKFGVGLKSIYQLGEAFFYLGLGPDTGLFEAPYTATGFVSPWVLANNEPESRQSWRLESKELRTADDEHIRQAIEDVCGWTGFTLWIPLRLHEHCLLPNGKEALIHSRFFDDRDYPEDIFDVDLEERLARLWPMLRNIKDMRVVGPANAARFSLRLRDGSRCRRYPTSDTDPSRAIPAERLAICGQLEGSTISRTFAGYECGVPELIPIRQEPHWPTSMSVTELENSQVPDKTLPHAAAVFILTKDTPESGRLDISWSVFLPVSKEHEESKPIGGSYHVQLSLHGYFFLTVDRTRILDWSGPVHRPLNSEAAVQSYWNRALALNGTLPTVLDALKELDQRIRSGDVADDEAETIITAISEGLAGSRLFQEHGEAMCRERSWVWRLGPQRTSRWGLVAGHQQVLSCPSLDELSQLFPNTEALATKVVTDTMHPLLSAHPATTSWDESVLIRLLENANHQFLQSPDGQRALHRFLQNQGRIAVADGLSTALLPVMARIIADSWSEFGSADIEALRELIQLVPETQRLQIPPSTPLKIVGDVLRSALSGVLAYPDSIGISGVPELNFRDAHRILQACAGQNDTHHLVKIAISGVDASQRSTLLKAVKGLLLFPVTRPGDARLASLEDLYVINQERRLFEPNPNQMSFVPKLQPCLAAVTLVQVEAEIARLLGLDPAKTNREAVLRFLSSRPDLVPEPRPRVELLASLLTSSGQIDRENYVLRYLLHGERTAFEKVDTLYFEDSQHSKEGAVIRKTLEHRHQGWRWLPDPDLLNQNLTGAALERLGARRADHIALVESLRGLDPHIGFPELEDDEYDFLLETIEDRDLLRLLPIHEATDGRRVALSETTWLESEYLVGYQGNSELFRGVTQIRRHPKKELSGRQEKLGLAPLDASAVVKLALEREDVAAFWRDLMSVLPHLPATSFGKQLSKVAWLPTADGRTVRPETVVNIAEVANLAAQAIDVTGANLIVYEQLSREVLEHPQLTDLDNKVLPTREESIEALGRVLGDLEAYCVGPITNSHPADPQGLEEDDEFTVSTWQEAMGPQAPGILAVEFLDRLHSHHATIWKHLQCPVGLLQLLLFLEHLRTRHAAEQNRQRKETILKLHDRYLKLACESSEWSLQDADILLLSKAGIWKPPNELCSKQHSVAKAHLVVDSQAAILGVGPARYRQLEGPVPERILPRGEAGWSRIDRDLVSTARALHTYFQPWIGQVRDELIGGFLALLGDHVDIRSMAEVRLGRFSIHEVRSGFDAEPRERQSGQPNSLPEKIELSRFVAHLESPASFEVENLLNEPLIVSSETHPETLIAGTKDTEFHEGLYYVGLRLLEIDPTTTSDLPALLRNTAKFLYSTIYNHPVVNLDKTFRVLSDSEQLALRVTQDLCLDSAFHYMHGQLGARSPELDALFRRWDDERYARTQRRWLRGEGGPSDGDATAQQVREDLRGRIEEDPDTGEVLLRAVRKKVADYQYELDSIPFELLQNADDALLEARELEPANTHNTTFVVHIGRDSLDLLHWGRPVNSGDRTKGHQRDLEKMLTINASDKNEGQTGKFGLGFKSVFLLADKPQVVSGDLGFEVIGGVYPRHLDAERFEKLRNQLTQHGDRSGTIIHLEGQNTQVAFTCDRFRRLASLTLLFTRLVDRIELITSDDRTDVQCPHSELSIPHATLRSIPDVGRALLLGDEHLTIALRMAGDRFEPFADDAPDVWVTVPTRKQHGFGFLLQGAFDLDIGRAQLAGLSEKNLRLARSGATKVALALKAMTDMSATELQRQLLLASSPGSPFWSSLFTVLGKGMNLQNQNEDGVRLAWTALWDASGAARTWIETSQALPTGLPGSYDVLTRLGDVRYVARKSMAHHKTFEAIASAREFRKAIPPGSIISHDVAARLSQLRVAVDATEFSLNDALRTVIGPDGFVTPTMATSLAPIFRPGLLEAMDLLEATVVQNHLRSMRFKDRFGQYQPASTLLMASSEPDEHALHEFAPDESRLAGDYDATARDSFAFCRGQVAVARETIAEWIRACSDNTRQVAALRYLLRGEDGASIAHHFLAGRVEGTWLEHLHDFGAMSGAEKHRLDELLGVGSVPPEDAGHEDDTAPSLVSQDVGEVFRLVAQRWQKEGEQYLEAYERMTYPWPLRLLPTYDPGDLEQRRNWLTLLLIGGMQGLGRVRYEQNRGFLQHCEQQGWMDTFARAGMPGRSQAEDDRRWMAVVEGHLKAAEEQDRQEYGYWFRLFVTVYQLATWLDVYVQLILGLDLAKDEQDIESVWSPNTSPRYSGSGISAPPLDRALRVGRHFVLRELRRKGVLKNRIIDPYAYLPSQRLRSLFSELLSPLPENYALASKAIYTELKTNLGRDDATFDGAFDLPFWFGLHEVAR